MADADKYITYSLADIQRYLQGDMNAKEMHQLERAALEDPFLADALEGYSGADMQQAREHLQQIEKAILQQEKKHKVIPLLPSLKKYHNWQLAASIILLIGIAGITYFIFNKTSVEKMLAKTERNNAAPATDSAQTSVQTLIPPATDTSAFANKKSVENSKQDSLLFANNIRKGTKELRRQPVEAPGAKTEIAGNNGKAALNAEGYMRKLDSAKETAGTVTDTQQSMPEKAPTVANELAIAAAPQKNDSNKAGLRAENARAMQVPDNGITGTVIDQHQQPIANAAITIKGRNQGTTTDEKGNFRLSTNDSTAEVVISGVNYEPVEKRLKKGSNNIVLNESSGSLSEVVVTELGIRRDKAANTTAVPQGGWQSFYEYLRDKLSSKHDSNYLDNYEYGDLQLEFSIDKSGEPFDFKISKTPDSLIANEAISAIKEGPKWIGSSKSRKKRVTVKL